MFYISLRPPYYVKKRWDSHNLVEEEKYLPAFARKFPISLRIVLDFLFYVHQVS